MVLLSLACLLLVLFAARLLHMRRVLGNYSDPGYSLEGAYAGEAGKFDGSLRVVTWNMHHAEHLEQAIETLEDVAEAA